MQRRRFSGTLGVLGLAGLMVLGLAAPPAADDPPRFSDWSAPVNLGPTVNSSSTEAGVFITKDGLSLYFSSRRPGGYGDLDLWVSRRATVDEGWGVPENLGPDINTSGSDTTPMISLDGHRLYYASARSGGFGGLDIWVSRRHNKRDDLGWQAPVNLGGAVNTPSTERGPTEFEDDATGDIVLYFSSNRPGGLGSEDIYASTMQAGEIFAPAVNIETLNSVSSDSVPAIRRDGLEIFLCSYRTGQLGGGDIWVATRPSTSDPWSEPTNLGAVVNSTDLDFRPAISFDGRALYFHSARPGGFGAYPTDYDLYVATRTREKGRD
jgi:Tol biopolymer transport system component